jgi:hypothetical protein
MLCVYVALAKWLSCDFNLYDTRLERDITTPRAARMYAYTDYLLQCVDVHPDLSRRLDT